MLGKLRNFLSGNWSWTKTKSWRRAARGRQTRLSVESLENRELLSAASAVTLAAPVAAFAPRAPSTILNSLERVSSPASENLPMLAQITHLLKVAEPARQLVIHSAQELLADTGLTTTELATLLKVPSIDWNTQMIVLVTQGMGAYGAWSPSADITSLKLTNGALTVNWHLVKPNPDQVFPMFMVKGNPADFVLTSSFNGPVVFQQGATVTLPPPQ